MSNQLEKAFKKKIEKFNIRREKTFKSKPQTELFILTKEYDMDHILSISDQISGRYKTQYSTEKILKLEKENIQKDKEIYDLKHKYELIQKDIEKERESMKLKLLLAQNNIPIPKDL